MPDAISKVIDNDKLLNELASSAFSYATKERTWSRTIEKTIDLYEEIL
jgi:glycosyltransferase involved in cell wall biosynthesis